MSIEEVPEALRTRLVEALAAVHTSAQSLAQALTFAELGAHLAHVDLNGPMAEVCRRVVEQLLGAGRLDALLDETAREFAGNGELQEVLDAVREVLLPTPTPRTDRPPFPGLFAYEEDDASLFRGRRREIAACLGRLAQRRVLWVTGASGAGKSSLIRAGVVPALRRRAEAAGGRLLLVDLRPGVEPFEALARAFQNKVDGAPTELLAWNKAMTEQFRADAGPEVLTDTLTTLLKDERVRLALVVDQLEALTTLRGEARAVRDAFLTALVACGRRAREGREHHARLQVIVAARSDLLGELLTHDGLDALYKDTPRQQVGALDTAALRLVVLDPVAGRAEVDDALPTQLAAELGNDPGRLPLLNLVLRQVWDAFERGGVSGAPRRLSVALYEQVGKLSGALGRTGDEALAAVKDDDRATLNRTLLALAHVDEGRPLRRVLAYDALAAEVRSDAAQLDRVLKALVARYLLRTDGEDGRRTVEVAHEALFGGWAHYRQLLEAKGPMLALQREVDAAAGRWRKHGGGELWLDGTQLHAAEAAQKAGTIELGEEAQAFLAASRRAIRRRRLWDRVVIGLLVGGVAAMALLFWRARSESARAEGHLRRAESLVEFMLVAQQGPLREVGRLDVLEASVRRVQNFYDELGRAGEGDSAHAQRMRSVVLNHRGDVQVAQGDLSGALASYRESKDIAVLLTRRDANNTEWQRDLSVSLERIGDVQVAQGDLSGALASYRESKDIRDQLTRRDANNTNWQRDLSVSLNKIGDVQRAQGDLSGALASYRESKDIFVLLTRRDANNTNWQRDLSVSLNKIGDVEVAQGDLSGALASYRESKDIRDRLTRRDANNTEWQRDLSVSLERIGDVQVAQGDLSGALASYRESKDIRDQLTRRDANNTNWQRDLSVSLNKIGDVQRAQGDLSGALASYRESKDIFVLLTRRDANNTNWQSDLAVSLGRIGDLHRALGEYSPAATAYEDALTIVRPLAARDPSSVAVVSDVAYYAMRLTRVRVLQPDGRSAALTLAREALGILRTLHEQHRLTAQQEPWFSDAQSLVASLEAATDAQLALLRPVVFIGRASASTTPAATVGGACRAVLTPSAAPNEICEVTVLCGEAHAIYGPPGAFPCVVTRAGGLHVTGRDDATDDGDGTVAIDTRAGTLSVADIARGTRPAFRVDIRLTGRAP